METSRPVNLYRLKAYPAGIAIVNPSREVPMLTISELTNQIQKESPCNILEKCSVEKESPISPPSAFPGEKAISMIHNRGIIVMRTKWSKIKCVEIFSCLFIFPKFRSNPNSIAEVDNLFEVQTVTARFESHHNERLEGIMVHA